jgi:hypothetical protein
VTSEFDNNKKYQFSVVLKIKVFKTTRAVVYAPSCAVEKTRYQGRAFQHFVRRFSGQYKKNVFARGGNKCDSGL